MLRHGYVSMQLPNLCMENVTGAAKTRPASPFSTLLLQRAA